MSQSDNHAHSYVYTSGEADQSGHRGAFHPPNCIGANDQSDNHSFTKNV